MNPLKDYYYLSVSLPELRLGQKPEISWPEVEQLLKDNLRKSDYIQVEILLRIFDLYNIRAWWQKLPMGFVGNWDSNQLQRHLQDQEELPKYLLQYLDRWSEDLERIKHFPELLADYYEKEEGSGFLKEYLDFEEKLRYVITSIRARREGMDLKKEEAFHRESPFIEDLLTLDDQSYPEPFDKLPEAFEKYKDEPLKLDQALDLFRYSWIEEKIDFEFFSFRYVLGYIAQFLMVDKELRQKKETEKDLIDDIVKDISDE